jgi:AcrR family transcriptional regulator
MLIAAVEVIGDLGYQGMSVARVCARAGVSRRTFYDLFEDRESCFLEVFKEAVARFALVAREAALGESSWRGRLRAGLAGPPDRTGGSRLRTISKDRHTSMRPWTRRWIAIYDLIDRHVNFS